MLKMNGVIALMLEGVVRRIEVDDVWCAINQMKIGKAS